MFNNASLMAFVAALAFVGLAGAYRVERCDNNRAIDLVDLHISTCPDKSGTDYCHMRLNERVKFEVRFNTSHSYQGRSFYTTVDIRDHDDRWRRVVKHQACDRHDHGHYGLRCPIEARRENYFKEEFDVTSNMVSSSYRIGLMDPTRGKLLCLQIPARVDGTEEPVEKEDDNDDN